MLITEPSIRSAEDEVTFNQPIATMIFDNCVECHRPEGIGPFSLTDYKSVAKRARQIAEVTESRFMPPWKPDPDYGAKLLN